MSIFHGLKPVAIRRRPYGTEKTVQLQNLRFGLKLVRSHPPLALRIDGGAFGCETVWKCQFVKPGVADGHNQSGEPGGVSPRTLSDHNSVRSGGLRPMPLTLARHRAGEHRA